MAAKSWVPVPDGSPFPVQNLPYCVFSYAGEDPRVGVAIGSYVLDLAPLAASEWADFASVFAGPSLNPFMALGRRAWHAVRHWLTERLTDESHRDLVEPLLIPMDQVRLHMPFTVADFVDFFASEHHATNMGRLIRPGEQPLTPNWRHLPIAYHSRAGSVAVSGTPVRRPSGQYRVPGRAEPVFGPTERLDFEAEVGFVIGTPTTPGQRLSVDDARDHIFGVVLVNDWSARDIQAWEYQPLGPFLGKSFLTSIGAWITPLAALSAARVPTPGFDHELLPYLVEEEPWGLDLKLAVEWNGTVVAHPPFAAMSWSCAQQLAHMTINGATVRPGDLFASGTVSGPEKEQRGCFLELTWGGREPVTLADGSERTFLEDGDTVTITATAPGPDGSVVGFAEVTGTVRPAEPYEARG